MIENDEAGSGPDLFCAAGIPIDARRALDASLASAPATLFATALRRLLEAWGSAHAAAPALQWGDGDGAALTVEGHALRLRDDGSHLDPQQADAVLEALAHGALQLLESGESASLDSMSAAQRAWLAARNPPLQPVSGTVHGVFAEQLAAHGDAPAVGYAGVTLSYAELDAHARALQQRLVDCGVTEGMVVGIALRRSPQAIAAMLAVLRCGAAYLPLDPSHPAERLAQMLADVQAALVLAPTDVADVFGAMPRLDPDTVVAVAALPRSPAMPGLTYVLYTSGSTGTPKGVAIDHSAVLRLVRPDLAGGSCFMPLAPSTRMLQAAPLTFDVSTLEIWGPLLNGGRCVVHDEDLPTPAGLARSIRTHHVNAACLTAALFNFVVDADVTALRGLEHLQVGGEALSIAHVRRAQRELPGLTLYNGYGPTECTMVTTIYRIPAESTRESRTIPIGRPIHDTRVYVLGANLEPLPPGLAGELCVGGSGLARGYVGKPELTAGRFVAAPTGCADARLYRTGDRARWRDDGTVEFLGRIDSQVKIRGFRVEPAEIQARLLELSSLRDAVVIARRAVGGELRLLAYLVAVTQPLADTIVRDHLARHLPAYMHPAAFVWLDALPLTANGKVDTRALPDPDGARAPQLGELLPPRDALEALICSVYARQLQLRAVGRLDNFFELGGNSLLALRAAAALREAGHAQATVAAFYAAPTAEQMAARLRAGPAPAFEVSPPSIAAGDPADPIAIVAVAGRFPGAGDVDALWSMLLDGRDGITRFADHELAPSLPPQTTQDPDYVKARGVIDGVESFDSAFFGIGQREADLMDPQQRVFLELCWHCMERAGHSPDTVRVPVGVFAGMHDATYFRRHVQQHPELIERLGEFQTMLGNEKDYLATRVANRLNLTGPAVSLNTACSTSLVAVAQAVLSLRAGQCDMALAGGVAITCPPRSGYRYQDGAMLSPDGVTRSFDANARGTVFSDGAAVVLLRRLGDALADGDEVLAVIRGVGVNNDGRDKASFTAPSSDGQAAVIAAALRDGGIDPASIGYLEAHGTATPIGDPIEVDALRRVLDAPGRPPCLIGSIKSNIGHAVVAAGAAGLIKAALSLAHEQIPRSLHYSAPNPVIDFGSALRVCDRLTPWPRGARPRRAGVSSFGVGGTNAHVVLEEAPSRAASSPPRGVQQLLLSARSEDALQAAAQALAQHLQQHPEVNLADVAWTLQRGRGSHAHRLAVVGTDVAQAAAGLRDAAHPWRCAQRAASAPPALVWMFPGQGAQYAAMGRELYAVDAVFHDALDEALQHGQGHALRARLFDDDPAALTPTELTQPALFSVEYALAQCWMARGLRPAALIGHSVGEFVCAVLAGVMTLADAARLVTRRGALMQRQPGGGMLAVRACVDTLQIPAGLSLAADNGPQACVVAGPRDALTAWAAQLESAGTTARLLQTSHAFHSPAMDGALDAFEAEFADVQLHAPAVPIISTRTGDWLDDAQAVDPAYWVGQLRDPVRFRAAVARAREHHADALFVEVGPGRQLCALARQQRAGTPTVASLGTAVDAEAAAWRLAEARLWCAGIDFELQAASPPDGRRRVALPGYAFTRRRHWIDAAPPFPAVAAMSEPTPVPSARRDQIIAQLRDLFTDIHGDDLADADASSPFVALGIDSLALTQAALEIKRQLGVPITFRELMADCNNFAALAAHVEAALPARAVEPPAPAAVVRPAAPAPSLGVSPATVVAPAAAVASVPTAALQQLIQQQMALMAQQLAALGAVPPAPPEVAASRTASPAPTPGAASTAGDDDSRRYDVKRAFGAIARIHTDSGPLSERQRARLGTFIRAYSERTARSRAYTERHRARLADPRVVNGFRPLTKDITYQIVVEHSKGSRLRDLDGNDYVDALNGFGMSLFGWQPDFVLDAVRAQLDAGYEIGPQHPLAGEVAERLCALTGNERAALCNTGSEAVMAALRIARTVTGRDTVVLFSGSYHGTFDEVVVRRGHAHRGVPGAPGIMRGMFGDVRVLDYGTDEALDYIRAHADELAAVLVEPVQSRRPDFQPIDFLKEVRAITARSGSCLIFDEVITGLRSAPGGTQELFGIRADLATYGKVVGGGMPIGVVAGRHEYMDALDGGSWHFGDDSVPEVGVTYFAGTFVRHPLALAAARASLQRLADAGPQLQQGLSATTAKLVDTLNEGCRQAGAPLEIARFASLWRVKWHENHPLQDLLFAMMRHRGVHILDNFPCFLTTAHTDEDLARIAQAFKSSLHELQESEFLPRRASPATFDSSQPPVPGARLGRDVDGSPAWFVADPGNPTRYLKVQMR